MNKLQINMKLSFQAPIHITGDRRVWGADKAAALSPQGSFVVPASTLKGNLRFRAETLLRTWEQEVCPSPEPGAMCHDLSELCLVCRVFGNARYRSVLRFSEAQAAPKEVTSEIRSGVSISRQRRTSMEQHLFFTETASSEPTTEWTANATGHFPTKQDALEAIALIYLAAKSGPALGGGKSRGLGYIESWQMEAILDGQVVSVEDLRQIWQVWAEGKK
jgi:CRISPR/Cas system CSM-associated protein Csm3 (group 7 of RAMP superfamily)